MKYLDKMVDLTNDLKNNKDNNTNSFKEIKEQVDLIKQYWTGEASSSFIEKFNSLTSSFDSYNETLNQYIDYLNEVDHDMTKLQESNSEMFK